MIKQRYRLTIYPEHGKYYSRDAKPHRLDGPAVEGPIYGDGYYINGQYFYKHQFDTIIKHSSYNK